MDVRREKSGYDRRGAVQENAGHLKIDGAVAGEPDSQGDGGHKEEHAAQPEEGIRKIVAEEVSHKVDHIGSLGVPEQVTEAQDRIYAEKSSHECHHIVEGSLIFFLIFHLSSPSYQKYPKSGHKRPPCVL